jgi:hypothetical protein
LSQPKLKIHADSKAVGTKKNVRKSGKQWKLTSRDNVETNDK